MKKIILLISLFICTFSNPIFSTHIIGTAINYRSVGGNDYIFTLSLYRDCSGISAPQGVTLCFYSQSAGTNFTSSLPLVQQSNLSLNCGLLSSTCNGGQVLGIEKHVYSDTVTLPMNVSDWMISWFECCRNNAISNLVNPGSQSMFTVSYLNNSITPFNNSVLYTDEPVLIIGQNQTHVINHALHDPDGDSLHVELMPALSSTSSSCGMQSIDSLAYLPGFLYTQPIPSAPAMTLDPQTGEITVSPTTLGSYVVRYRVYEYRNGVLIASSDHDFQIIVVNTNNQVPDMSGINSTSNYTLIACAGDTLNFTLQSSDPDLADSTSIEAHSLATLPYTVTSSGPAQNEAVAVQIITDSSSISSFAHLLFVRTRDNACPINAVRTRMYKIYVNQCITNDVWPGDANSDLVANMYDILPIGIAYGATGPMRTGASISWVAQASVPWGQTLASSIDYKHVDCDGNGVIDSLDYIAVSTNYGSTHARIGDQTPITAVNGHDLAVSFSNSLAAPGQYMTASFDLSNVSGSVNDVYGIAFTLNFDASLVQNGLLNFNQSNSWLLSSSDMFRNIASSSGQYEIGLVRTNQQNVSGTGSILDFNFIVEPSINSIVANNFYISNIRLIDNVGNEFPVNALGGVLTVDPQASVEDVLGLKWSITPNPAKDRLSIHFVESIGENSGFEINDLQGRLVFKNTLDIHTLKKEIDISSFEKGVYIIRIQTQKGLSTKTFVKL